MCSSSIQDAKYSAGTVCFSFASDLAYSLTCRQSTNTFNPRSLHYTIKTRMVNKKGPDFLWYFSVFKYLDLGKTEKVAGKFNEAT